MAHQQYTQPTPLGVGKHLALHAEANEGVTIVTELKIEGMTCGHCRTSVQEALEGVEGTENVQVDLDAGRAQIGGTADIERLVAAVEAEGYRASPAS